MSDEILKIVFSGVGAGFMGLGWFCLKLWKENKELHAKLLNREHDMIAFLKMIVRTSRHD